MKKSVPAASPQAYIASLRGWQGRYAEALRAAVLDTIALRETVKWGHLVYFSNGPVLLIRAEENRVLFGFWRGQRLRHIEPRLKPGGKYEMATLELVEGTQLEFSTVVELVRQAVALNASLGDPTAAPTTEFAVRPLDPSTWPDFAALVERHNGVWGGCWCLEFHAEGAERTAQRRDKKECRVREGTTHAALVYDGPSCVGWCQFGSPSELPRIKHQRAYREGLTDLPDWRITCFFVDKAYRGKGVAAAALGGALREIARLGGGTVESYPQAPADRPVSSSFLYNGSISMFEQHGFERVRRLGKNHWVVARVVSAASP